MREYEMYLHNPFRKVGEIKADDLAVAIRKAKKIHGDCVFVCGKPKD